MKTIGAGFGRDVQNATRSAAIFRTEVAGDDAELFHGIQRNSLQRSSAELIHVISTVQSDVGAGGTLSVDRDTRSTSTRIRVGHIGGQGDECVRVAIQRGHLLYLFRVDN